MEKRVYELKGLRSNGKIVLSGISKIREEIPAYFTLEIDMLKIRRREKEK